MVNSYPVKPLSTQAGSLFPDKPMDIPISTNPASTNRQTDRSHHPLPSLPATLQAMWSDMQCVRLHQAKKGGQRVKGSLHHLPWERKEFRRKRLFLLPPLCPTVWGRVTVHTNGVQANICHLYQGQRHALPMTEGLCSKVSPLPRVKVTGDRGNGTLPALGQ